MQDESVPAAVPTSDDPRRKRRRQRIAIACAVLAAFLFLDFHLSWHREERSQAAAHKIVSRRPTDPPPPPVQLYVPPNSPFSGTLRSMLLDRLDGVGAIGDIQVLDRLPTMEDCGVLGVSTTECLRIWTPLLARGRATIEFAYLEGPGWPLAYEATDSVVRARSQDEVDWEAYRPVLKAGRFGHGHMTLENWTLGIVSWPSFLGSLADDPVEMIRSKIAELR